MNAVNGLQDGIIGMANFGLTITGIGPIAGLFGWNLNIPSPDWSNGLIVTESQSAHNISKLLGGQGLTELLTFGASTLAESGVICKLTGWGCFVAGTEVVTGQNTNGTFSETPIQDIQVGDYVLSRNQYDPNGPLQEEQVTAVEQHTVFSLQDVKVENADGATEVIQATPNHPFYVQGAGWTDAGDLVAGEELEEPDGSYADVVSSEADPESAGVTVYNLKVNDDHTYFVDQGGAVVWVHNTCNSAILRRALDASGEVFNTGDQAAHVVPAGMAKRVADVQESINDARAVLARQKLVINTSPNGFVARSGHLGTHTSAYLRILGQN